jgi:hypothetical protein
MYPFSVQDDLKWNAILKKYNIPDSTWQQMKSEYLDEAPHFNPKIIDDAPYEEFYDLTYPLYYYGEKTPTYPQAKRMFRTYVRRFWNMFCGKTLVEVCSKIAFAIQTYNHSRPITPQRFINLIPSFEGKQLKTSRVAKISIP